MVEQQKKKRFALFLIKCDSEFVKKVNGGYFNIFVSTCGEDGEQWDLFRVIYQMKVADTRAMSSFSDQLGDMDQRYAAALDMTARELQTIARHEANVNQYAEKFEKLAWGKVLTSLPENPAEKITPEIAKELFASFNEELEAAYRKQISWVIPDPKLRDQTKILLSQTLMLVCTEFYEINRFGLGENTFNAR
ncbi:hypothetical protein IGI04_040945 [Brassica rapa subsp. trilocularis]|uniref:Exocyst subunit Exo70 family protein n=1 Tax=Brassica rapa subsp. trilocularis TaxID=1813537 RepID=A0ABQ7KSS5_BRACM|nr:hypothetical protein IGI04_040945 [Brassica rapa subsp. trilocularis]